MDVRLPDGTLVRGVPDTMSKAEFTAMARSKGYDVGDPDEATAESQRLARSGNPDAYKSNPVTGLDPTAQAYRAKFPNVEEQAPGWIEQGVGGVKHAWDRAAMGLKGLVTGLTPEDRQLLQQGEAFVKQTGPASTIGQIAGDVGITAPAFAFGGAALGLPRAAAAISALRKAAPATTATGLVAGDLAANSGLSAALAPDDRADAAKWGAGGAAVGRVLSRTLGGLVRPGERAQALMDQGVRLTPGQAGEGVMGQLARVYEDALGSIPVAGRGVQRTRKQGLEDWNRAMLKDAAHGPVGLEDFGAPSINRTAPIGAAGIDDLTAHYSGPGGAYKALFPDKGVLQFTDEGARAIDTEVKDPTDKLPLSLRGKFEESVGGITDQIKAGVPAPLWKEVVTGDIEAARQAAYRNGDNSLVRALAALDKKLLSHMEEGRITGAPDPHELANVDAGYAKFKVLQKAGQKAAAIKRGGMLYPSEVAVEAAKRRNFPQYSAALEAQNMFGNAPTDMGRLGNMVKAAAVGTVGHGVAGGLAIPAAAASLLGTTEVGRRFLLGQIPWQFVVQNDPQIAEQVGRALATEGVQ